VRDRLSDLVDLLKTGKRQVTRRFLEKRWICSTPTVHRIIARAKVSGIPIVYENLRYRLEEDVAIEIPSHWLKPDELAALLGLSHWLEILASGVLKERLAPIHTRLEEMLQNRGLGLADWKERIRLLPIHHRPTDPDILLSAARAVLSRKRIALRYLGVKDTQSRVRDVSPQTLVRYRDNWYLDGFDHDSGKLREFALSRMSALEFLSEPIQEIARPDLDGHFADAYGVFAGRARRKAILIFEGLAARLVGEERWHPKQKMSVMPGAKLRLEFPCGNVQELARDVMRFADEVTVEGPEELRLAVVGMLQGAGKRWGLGVRK
jgi:proteasome accessory factor C